LTFSRGSFLSASTGVRDAGKETVDVLNGKIASLLTEIKNNTGNGAGARAQ